VSTQARKDAVRRLYRALEAGDLDVAGDLFTADFVTSEGEHQNVTGPQGFMAAIREVHEAYGNPRFEILDIVGEDDAVTVRWRMQATHRGELLGFAPTGQPIDMEAFALFRFAGDRISERHAVIDRLGLLQQLQEHAAQ
jgi:predicted ester cyclase